MKKEVYLTTKQTGKRSRNIYNNLNSPKNMIDVNEKKTKILSFLESSGPSLPVRIARAIEMEPVFASAILSELLNEKRVKISNMKVGSSTLYLLPGQEEKLENYTDNLKPVEKEAFLKLKEKKVLYDEREEPRIRVALRGLKDFAEGIRLNERIIWKYTFTKKEEIENILNKPKEKNLVEKETKKIESHEKREKTETIEKEKKEDAKIENIFEEEKEKTDEELEFFNEINRYLEKNHLKLEEEIQIDKKEIVAKISIPTKIGSLNFLLIAKNKKTISRDEIKSALQRASYYKMPCLFLAKKEPTKNLLNFIKDYENLLKIDLIS